MVARLEKTEQGYAILLTEEMVEELHLSVGEAVDVRPAEDVVTTAPKIRYASADEVMKIHRQLEPENAKAYAELAK
jgi:antitoxin component of MazEF toxin-antitoxin module